MPVKLLELMSKTRRNVRFPRWGEMVPVRPKPEISRVVTLRCLMPQETPIQLQMEVLIDQFLSRMELGMNVMVFLKVMRAC